MAPKRRFTAGELLDELALDPDYQARRAVLDEEHRRRVTETARAARPLVDDLRAIGASVDYVNWDISAFGVDYTNALPVLCRHLYLDHPAPIPGYIARTMALPSARQYRKNFIELFRDTTKNILGFREGLAVAIAETTDRDNIPETIGLLRDRSLGRERVLLLRPLRRSRDPTTVAALEELRSDFELAVELATWPRFKKPKSASATAHN